MEVRLQHAVQEFKGDGRLTSIVVKNMKTGEVEEMRPAAAFIFIGLDPNTEFLADTVELDKQRFVKTGANLETNIPGVFAAGDMRAGSTKQVASAVGEGATVALMVRQYLEDQDGSRAYKGD